MKHIGSFSGKLKLCPLEDYNCSTFQTVKILVEQNNTVLATQIVENIDKIQCKLFNLTYYYQNLSDPVCLVMESCIDEDQHNRDNPVEITELMIDNLYTVDKFIFRGELIKRGQRIDIGNCLYDTGRLIYTFKIPIFQEVVIG